MSDTNANSGASLISALQMIFIVNKLTDAGEIGDWSWWWVLSPIWITLAFVVVIGVFQGIGKALDR